MTEECERCFEEITEEKKIYCCECGATLCSDCSIKSHLENLYYCVDCWNDDPMHIPIPAEE